MAYFASDPLGHLLLGCHRFDPIALARDLFRNLIPIVDFRQFPISASRKAQKSLGIIFYASVRVSTNKAVESAAQAA
jgi:hypothetical protein